jgi:hypothetical protein
MVDSGIHHDKTQFKQIFPRNSGEYLAVMIVRRRTAIRLRGPADGFVMFK